MFKSLLKNGTHHADDSWPSRTVRRPIYNDSVMILATRHHYVSLGYTLRRQQVYGGIFLGAVSRSQITIVVTYP